MKNNLLKIGVVFLLGSCSSVFSQSYYYDFSDRLNSLISEKNNEIPTIFEIDKTPLAIKINSRKKVETEKYKQLKVELDLAIKDSIGVANKNEERIYQYTQINKIKSLINKFASSKAPYEIKKEQLIKAQKIAIKTHSDFLIYADETINSSNKTKYFILSKRPLDLKVHLKKIVWKIENTNLKPDLIKPKDLEKIKRVKKELKSIKQFEYINGPLKTKNKTLLVLGKEVNGSSNLIVGQFKGLGEYYVVLRKRGTKTYEELVSSKKIDPSKSKEKLVFATPTTLIKKNNTGELYLVATGFLNEYSLTKLSQQDKFKDKVKLPFKIYSTVNDRLIDSIILNYNRVTLNLK